MAVLIVNGSGSQGNSYILRCEDETLLIECGMPYDDIVKYVNFDISSVVGCIVSHKHSDHCKSITAKRLNSYGVSVYGDQSVADVCDCVNVIAHKQRFKLGNFSILPLSVPHGDCSNFAYVIDCADESRIVFATDLTKFPYFIKDCDCFCIEANYSWELRQIAESEGKPILSKSENHMELSTALSCIQRHINDNLTEVVLLHLSDGLSDCGAFIRAVRGLCESKNRPLVHVYAATAGQKIPIRELPF